MKSPATLAIAALALVVVPTPATAQDGEAEMAMDAYVRCLDARYQQLRVSCEPAGFVMTAVFAGCTQPQQRLEQTIMPFHRFYEEMKLTMAGIRVAQQDRLIAMLVEYRLTTPCAAR